MDFSYHLSHISAHRTESKVKELYKYFVPGMVNLAGGLPHYSRFPHTQLSADLHHDSPSAASEISIPLESGDEMNLKRLLQYGTATGDAVLLSFLRSLISELHAPANNLWQVILSCGNTDAMGKVVSMLADPDENEYFMFEEFTYPAALQTCLQNFNKAISLPMDRFGIIPEKIEHILRTWKGKRRLRLLYTVPIGQNPTGINVPAWRKKQIMNICNDYDLILIEDDPYYHLNYSESSPSYLHYDTQGRVIRLDTFSKTVCPGSRVGYIIANETFIERLLRHSEISTQQPSGYAQSIISKTLLSWGVDGYKIWVDRLCQSYRERLDVVCRLLDGGRQESRDGDWTLIQPPNNFEYTRPDGGMFIWARVLSDDPERIWKKLIGSNCLVSPGWMFGATEADEKRGKNWFRICFCASDEGDIVKAIKVFIKIVNS